MSTASRQNQRRSLAALWRATPLSRHRDEGLQRAAAARREEAKATPKNPAAPEGKTQHLQPATPMAATGTIRGASTTCPPPPSGPAASMGASPPGDAFPLFRAAALVPSRAPAAPRGDAAAPGVRRQRKQHLPARGLARAAPGRFGKALPAAGWAPAPPQARGHRASPIPSTVTKPLVGTGLWEGAGSRLGGVVGVSRSLQHGLSQL